MLIEVEILAWARRKVTSLIVPAFICCLHQIKLRGSWSSARQAASQGHAHAHANTRARTHAHSQKYIHTHTYVKCIYTHKYSVSLMHIFVTAKNEEKKSCYGKY